MFKVGLTGNIGSGKTTVALVFQALGVPVFFADEVAKAMYDLPDVRHSVIALFGPEAYYHDGKLNRQFLASTVFNDPASLKKLNALIHPLVRERFTAWSAEQGHHHYVLYEAAILFESGFYRLMDHTILVTAPESLRINRIVNRDRVSEAQVKLRMQYQWTEEKKQPMADDIIINDERQLVLPQVLKIHEELLIH